MLQRRLRGAITRQSDTDDMPLEEQTQVQWPRLFSYLLRYRARLALALGATVFSAAFSLVFPLVVQVVVDTVLEDQNLALLNQITLVLLAVFLLRSVTSFLEVYNLNYIGEHIVVDLRLDLYRHLQEQSLGFFVNRRVGELVSRISSDVTIMRTVLTNNVNNLLQQSLIMIGAVALMLMLNWRLTLFIIALMPLVVLISFSFGFLLRRISTRVQDEIAQSTVVAEEVLQGIREVKSFARESYEIERYGGAVGAALQAAIRLLRVRAFFGPTVGFLAFASLSLILWFGGREVVAGRLSGGELVAFLIYGLTVAGSFSGLIALYSSVQEAIGATRRVFQILDTVPDVRDSPEAVALGQVEGAIRFENVTFSYEGKLDVLKGIDLNITPGEIVALVGPSGAGKSTTFNLIPRFYDPTDGRILIDGQDLREVTQASLRQNIGIVPQDTLLFGSSVRENIRYGRLDASEAEIIEAARAANAHEFIEGLPEGYDTLVGERGVKLSGGQRQRVAIARAILKNPRILLLDEATSSLDSESEKLVQDALNRLMQNRTTVIIAHRLSTVRVADRIAVLNEGQIVELGTHDQLMTQGGLYARLYEIQFREDDGQPAPAD